MTTVYMAQDASVHENKLSVEVSNSLNTTVQVSRLEEIYNLYSQREICTARGWLQRHIQELLWEKFDKKRAKQYIRSVILGAAKMDAIIFVPIEIVEYGLEEKLASAITDDEKESIKDSLATVREDIATGGKFYCIDGQNRIIKSIVPFLQSKFPLGREPLYVSVDGKRINLANKKFNEFPKSLKTFVRDIGMLVVIADRGSVDDFVNALIWKNDGIPWGPWMKILTYNWYTSYRRHIAAITESKGNIQDLLHKLGGATYHHDSNGWELITSELLFWMKEGRWPKNLQDHTDAFDTWKSQDEKFVKKLKKYLLEYSILPNKKITHMEIKNYVILRYALDNRKHSKFKNLTFIPTIDIIQPKNFPLEFRGWHDIMKKDDATGKNRWPDAYVNAGVGRVKKPGSYLWANSEFGNEFIQTRLELLCARILENEKWLESNGVARFDEPDRMTIEQTYDYNNRNDIFGKEVEHFALGKYHVGHRKSKAHRGSDSPENTAPEEAHGNMSRGKRDHGLT